MSYILGTALIAVCWLLGLLIFLDERPKAFLYRVMSRFMNAPQSLRAIPHDAPYRRIGTTPGGIHRPVLLNIETSDGSGQACHPDVAYVPEGFGEKRWKFWMACTPYPYMDSALENPEIFASHDGVNWVVPDRVRNPVVPKPGNAVDHNSDPDLLFCGNELWLFYRETLRSKTPAENRIYAMKSSDGTKWSTPVGILCDKRGAELLSPAVVHDGERFWMWMVEVNGGKLNLVRRSSGDGLDWTEAPVGAEIRGLGPDRQPWHIDVVKEKDRLSAVLVSCKGLGGLGSRIHYAFSKDNGLTWTTNGFLVEPVYEFEGKIHYRTSLRQVDGHEGEYELWYSAASVTDVFSIAYMRMVRLGDRLVPLSPGSDPE